MTLSSTQDNGKMPCRMARAKPSTKTKTSIKGLSKMEHGMGTESMNSTDSIGMKAIGKIIAFMAAENSSGIHNSYSRGGSNMGSSMVKVSIGMKMEMCLKGLSSRMSAGGTAFIISLRGGSFNLSSIQILQ